MATAETTTTTTAISDYLRSRHLPPTAAWLSSFTASLRPNTPLPSLQKTALFRILAADLVASVQLPPTSLLPPDIARPEVPERRLAGPVPVQLLDIADVGQSRWSQVEQIEAQDRGETTKGGEIIRVVDEEPSDSASRACAAESTSGPHKLLLQDARGTQIYAFDLSPVTGVSLQQSSIGMKLVLRDVIVARGVALLDGKNVELLGGKVDSWDKKWRSERKETLTRQARMNAPPREDGEG